MTKMSCAEVDTHLMDLVYGELPDQQRAAVQAHVDGCARCQGELEALVRVRGLARQVVRRDLEQAAPAGVRARVLAAAAAAVKAPDAASPVMPPALGWVRRIWDWLRRPWMIPAFAAAATLLVFVLARDVIVVPERAHESARGPAALFEESPAPPAAAPGAQPRRPEVAGIGEAEEVAVEAPAKRRRRGPSSKGSEAPVASAAPPPPRAAMARDEGSSAGARAKAAVDADHEVRAAPASRHDDRPAPRAQRGAPAEASSAQAKSGAFADKAAPEAQRTSVAGGVARKPVRNDLEDLSTDVLLRRAERAYEEQRWGDAAAAYRELLRRLPGDERAPSWRRRLERATNAPP